MLVKFVGTPNTSIKVDTAGPNDYSSKKGDDIQLMCLRMINRHMRIFLMENQVRKLLIFVL